MKFYKKTCDYGWMVGCVGLGRIEYEKGNIVQAAQLLEEKKLAMAEGWEWGDVLV